MRRDEIEKLIPGVDLDRPSNMKFTGHKPVEEGESVLDTERRPVEHPGIASSIRPSTMPFKWFTLAPLYFYTPIAYSLVDQFGQSDLGKDMNCFVFKLDFPIVNIPGWEFTLKGLAPEYWEKFEEFIKQCGFFHRKRPGNVITVRSQQIKFKDKKTLDNSPFTITVFLPDKQGLRLDPFFKKDVLNFKLVEEPSL